jgi:hypothetical protein
VTIGEEARVLVEDDSPNRVVVSEEQMNVVRLIADATENRVKIGVTGIQGPAGTQIITGSGDPSNSIGRIGDFYYDQPNGNLWGPKTAAGWGTEYIALASFVSLDEVTDVDAPAPQEQDVLMYDEATNTWRNQRIRHRHDQPAPSDEWVIAHGLNTKPAAVAIFDTSNTMVFGDVDHVDENNLVIRFSAPFAGTAYLT